jgi:putative endonuclease
MHSFFVLNKMIYFVYILYSSKLACYYTGCTSNIARRLEHHNSGQNRFSKKGVPWELVASFECSDKKSALQLERKIKSRGAKRYLSGM